MIMTSACDENLMNLPSLYFCHSLIVPYDSGLNNFVCGIRYFKTLQEELESYDCVLYEMVASRESLENRRNPTATKKLKSSRSRGFNILGCIQRQMARILMLDFQLDCLDYQGDNWYHADLDFETFKLLQVRFSMLASF